MSKAIDLLWSQHVQTLRVDRNKTEDIFAIWGQSDESHPTSTAAKDEIRAKGIFNHDASVATPYHRLKLVMDYWCAMWFWPLDKADLLPDRATWLMELNLILQTEIYNFNQPEQDDLAFNTSMQEAKTGLEPAQSSLFDEAQPSLSDSHATLRKVLNAKGQLHLPSLYKQFPRLGLIKQIADKFKFFHWELNFADLFADRGGFDVMLGNPPWLKVEWNEGGVLGDFNPEFLIKKLSATQLRERRLQAFDEKPNLAQTWFTELEEAEGTQSFLNAVHNYPELKGIQTNLYKCFLPLAWKYCNQAGVIGFLHPEGVYDDPKGGEFRGQIYPRLKGHYQFQNQFILFPIGHRVKFSINVFGELQEKVSFTNIANLFTPNTIDFCLSHNGLGLVPGIKNTENNWDVSGHSSRMLTVTIDALKIFSKLYDSVGTKPLNARLPSLHSQELLSVLDRFAEQPKRLVDIKNDYFSSVMFDETYAQREKTIKRNTSFPNSTKSWVLSGPHFFVGSPFHKTPNAICNEKSHYSMVSLEDLDETYLPRTNYIPGVEVKEYIRRVPSVPWIDKDMLAPRKVTDYYRICYRAMIGSSSERTLCGAIYPPGVAHTNGVRSYVYKDIEVLAIMAAAHCSLPFDFMLKASGVSNLHTKLEDYPLVNPRNNKLRSELMVRIMSLTALTKDYSDFWHTLWKEDFEKCSWTKKLAVETCFDFKNLSSVWNTASAARLACERRQALLEIDVLISIELGLSLKELLTIYRVQFPVLQQYENETYYDKNGRIVFTPSKGLVDIGFPRNVGKNEDSVIIEYPDGTTESKPMGWNEAKDLPAETKILRTVIDDTKPGGPVERVITYTSPWHLPNREEDYRVAWEVFSERFGIQEKDF